VGGRLVSGRRLLHMIGNAHIDPVWLWQWPEGYQEVRATFHSALDRMDEYPEFVFTCTSVAFLDWVDEHDPGLFERIRARVADGRWQVIGGWWIEPDCNIPSGESLVRQGLYGQRWLRERLGITATTGANLDSFGHNASIPQLLAGSGMDSYVFLRPQRHEKELPGPIFRWVSPDGSSVLAYRIPHEYCSPSGELDEQIGKALEQLPADEPELMVFYGVGNHGGGPTKTNLDSIRRLDESGDLPHLRCSSTRAFFDSVGGNGDLPEYAGDLLHHSPGCYGAHSGIKRWNRRGESLLQRAEKWAAVAERLGGPAYPLDELTNAWKLLLFNQFHDTLAGTSIAPAYEDARDQLGYASSVAAHVFNRSIQSVARQIAIPFEEGTTPVVVFNPHPWPVQADSEFEFAGFRGGAEGGLVDADGAPVALQRARSYATVNPPRGRFVFRAELPPLGYRTYRLRPQGPAVEDGPVSASHTMLENEHVLLELDAATGRIARLVHKASGLDVAGDGARAVAVRDSSDTWGHGVHAYDDVISELTATSVRLVESGPVRAVLRVESSYGGSTLAEELVLSAGARHVDLRVTLDWHERLQLLKLRFPTSVRDSEATFEIPYGHIVRAADGAEDPAQAWVDVSGPDRGLAVLNDGKYGHDVKAGDIGVTVARSPVYAWHDPKQLEEDGVYEYLDQGRQQFTLRLVPHAGDWREAGIVRLAAELNQPVFPLLESFHEGPLPSERSFAADGAGPVVLSVVKAAEDGDGSLVVRAYESTGRPAGARLEVLGRPIEAQFGPAEIKTFRLPLDPEAAAVETDLLEW
jgi:alpha-mannosidase